MSSNTAKQDLAEVEARFDRIKQHKGVIGYIIINAEGQYIKTTLDNSTTTQYQSLISQLTRKGTSFVRELNPQDDLRFMRIQTQKHEIMIAPENDYTVIVIQDLQ